MHLFTFYRHESCKPEPIGELEAERGCVRVFPAGGATSVVVIHQLARWAGDNPRMGALRADMSQQAAKMLLEGLLAAIAHGEPWVLPVIFCKQWTCAWPGPDPAPSFETIIDDKLNLDVFEWTADVARIKKRRQHPYPRSGGTRYLDK